MTDTNKSSDLVKKLTEINSKFLPVKFSKEDLLDEHFEEFLNLFINKFNNSNEIGCVLPIYFTLDNWKDWSYKDFEYPDCASAIDMNSLNRLYTYQLELDKSFESESFTKIAVSDKREARKNFLIELDEDIRQPSYNLIENSIHKFSFPQSLYTQLTNSSSINFVKKLKRGNLETSSNGKINVSCLKEKINEWIKHLDDKIGSNAFLNDILTPVMSHSLYLIHDYSLLFVFSHTVSQIKNEFNGGLGGIFVLIRKKFLQEYSTTQKIVNLLGNLADKLSIRVVNYYQFQEIYKNQLKSALISILVDSYAHNISAHSLAALKWWFELRHNMLDKRFSVPTELKKLNPQSYTIDTYKTKVTTKKYYDALGLTDSSYDEGFYSLYDFLQFADQDTSYKLLSFIEQVKLHGKNSTGSEIKFKPRFPIPIDYALYPFFRFLRDKGAFWSGVTRDVANGGETKTWYKILWEDFANNPLYLGTIAKSEGITKLNINLAVEQGDEFYHGRFVTIDLSVIEYEEKLANDPNLELKEENKDLLEIYHKDEEYCKIDNCNCPNKKHKSINVGTNCFQNGDDNFVETKSYSKYAFIRLGKCFAHFREILDTEEFTAYLPGGIIGEHALFTIFENQIRNIKHYKNDFDNIKENGIDFWISIKKDNLNKVSTAKNDKLYSSIEEDDEINQLFQVGVWLAHKTDLGNERTVSGKPNYDGVLIKKVTDSTIEPIIDENASPRMGGNSQDKACAAMLFNNEFKSVERKKNEKEKSYFPWVTFATALEKEPFDDQYIDKGQSKRYVNLIDDDRKNEFAKEYLKKIGINEANDKQDGYLKKYFYLWQGADYIEVEDVKDIEGENVSRFKFAIVNVDDIEKKKDIVLKLRKNGVIRILENIRIEAKNGEDGIKKKIETQVKSDFELNKDNQSFIKQFVSVEKETKRRVMELLYQKWLWKWLNKNDFITILGEHWSALKYNRTNISLESQFSDLNKLSLPLLKNLENNKFDPLKYHYLPLSHGGTDEAKKCNVRSHGSFWSKFFKHIESRQPKDLLGNNYPKDKYQGLFEFLEILTTQIVIYDNRLNERVQRLSGEKREMFKSCLNLKIFKEEKFTGKLIEELKKQINLSKNGLPLVLIMHLSFIENLGFTEENILKFIKTHISDLFNSDKFIFVVTTGRGRDAWRSSLEQDPVNNFEILKKTIFKPVESLLSAVESGISYNDNFDVKYNLIKVIFGS